ncbi:hypothetical protein Slin15195_G110720 [Septoria linicola]|uniref:Uncharacterized protein n=1 Tax=Septoria linicola TaxID=215465 RepID=A0A9Q9EQP1_9PEZI|nr:hypothetical protein Slin15195_G110720 [Septoria linicola]
MTTDLTHSFEDISSPINTLLTETLTISSLDTLYTILHTTYARFDKAVQDAANAGLQLSPRQGERLTQFDTDKMLRQMRERNADESSLRPHAEDVRRRADRVERQIVEVEKAIRVKAENDRMDEIVFEPTMNRDGDRDGDECC